MYSTLAESGDRELVEAVRAGDDAAFEELYRRYQPRIAGYVRRMVRDPARAEDLAQDAFCSALRRMRATDSEIVFRPWIFEIARNAAIDHWRRSSRAEEISVEEDGRLRQSDRARLTGASGPDAVLVDKERLDHLRGAFDELSDVHTRILVMRELEGLSYREIAERLDLTRSSVESALFRARRRLESEYADISEGRRCVAMRGVMARMAEGVDNRRDQGRLARHARRCHVCRRRARELGLELLPPLSGLRRKAAALLPLPLFARRGGAAPGGGNGTLSGLLPAVPHVSAVVAERAAALVAAATLAAGGGLALTGDGDTGAQPDAAQVPAHELRSTGSGKEPGTDRSPASRSRPRPGGEAGEAGSGSAMKPDRGTGARGETGAAGSAGGGSASGGSAADGGGTGSRGDAPGVPGVDAPAAPALPALPEVPRDVGGGAPELPSGAAPRLPEPPAPPNVERPPVPEPPTVAPRVEASPPVPVEPPPAPSLPQPDTGVQPGGVAPIGGG
jgi:RNA polymerase sigma factor (sigma-70 family)